MAVGGDEVRAGLGGGGADCVGPYSLWNFALVQSDLEVTAGL